MQIFQNHGMHGYNMGCIQSCHLDICTIFNWLNTTATRVFWEVKSF